jgi:hypothetical protein
MFQRLGGTLFSLYYEQMEFNRSLCDLRVRAESKSNGFYIKRRPMACAKLQCYFKITCFPFVICINIQDALYLFKENIRILQNTRNFKVQL